MLFPEGQLECERYEQMDKGVELYNQHDDLLAFVPYYNLHAIIDDEHATDDSSEPSVMLITEPKNGSQSGGKNSVSQPSTRISKFGPMATTCTRTRLKKSTSIGSAAIEGSCANSE